MTDYNRDNEQYTPENDGRSYDDIYSSQPEQQPINQTAEQSTSEASTVQKVQATTQQYTTSQAEQQPPIQNTYAQAQQPITYNSPYSQQYQQPTYSTPYYQPQPIKATDVRTAPKKKNKTAKRVAIITASLALVACIGIGGGFLGSKLASSSVTPTSTENSSSTSKAGSSETSKGSLNITKNEGTKVAATSTQEVAEKAANSVVEITTESVVSGQYMQQYVSTGAGSGVIISEDGYIITNNHVIDGANTITVTLKNGKSYTAKLIGKDSQVDVALLKIEETGLSPVTFGDSDNLKVGETAVAIGNPLGKLGGTVTSGIISALNREITIDGETMNLLQTNAAINPGNSGGGLFNANAELVGLVVAKSSGSDVEGLGFAIPINDVVNILQDLMDHGYVTGRPSLGVSLTDISEDQLFSYRLDEAGTYVAQVTSGSAAEKAGIKLGDLLVKIDDTEITSSSQAASLISKHKAGDEISITVKRDGKEQTVKATLDESTTSSDKKAEQSSSATYPYQGYGNYGGYGF